MFNLSRKMKRMLAVVLVETIVATNVLCHMLRKTTVLCAR